MRFPLVSFKRVFDVEVVQQCASLEQLVEGLLRFELRPASRAREERDRAQLEAAWRAWQEGSYRGGPHYSELLRVQHEAARTGAEPRAAVEEAYERLQRRALDKSKRDLRLWSPALYAPALRRGSESVLALSCLVLDYDDGSSAEQVQDSWGDWLHVLHSTWSHSADKAKLRVCLPLARLVGAPSWRPLWSWARERTRDAVDPAPSSPGSTFALPAVSSPRAPRLARLHDGPLLDAQALGLAPHCEASPGLFGLAADSHFLPDPSRDYLEEPHAPIETEEWDLEAAFEDLF